MTHLPIVYVVDDDDSMRAALADLLASVNLQARCFSSTRQFLDSYNDEAPACLVLDVRMPGQSGLDFHRQMAGLGLRLPTVFISGHGDIATGVQAMKNGAIEFLTKPFRDQELLDAIQNGIETDRTRRVEESMRAALYDRWNSLSAGEQDVVRLVVCGLLNKQVADQLHVSEITVKVRRASAMRKLETETLTDLVRLAQKLGM
ncbi:MAG: response regulator [Duganella sp.]